MICWSLSIEKIVYKLSKFTLFNFKDARSVSLYPYDDKSCNMLSMLNKLTLQ